MKIRAGWLAVEAAVILIAVFLVGGVARESLHAAPAVDAMGAMTDPAAMTTEGGDRILLLYRVCILSDTTLPGPAYAYPDTAAARCPAIVLNPTILGQLRRPLQVFVILHEYAHVVLGHRSVSDTTERVQSERNADCAAARIMGHFWPDELDSAVTLLRQVPLEERVGYHGQWQDRAERLATCGARP